MSTLKSAQKETLARVFKNAVKESAEAHFLHRLHCVQLVAQGHSANEVAKWFVDDPSSVARWARHFKNFGAEGLRDEKKPGRPPKLDPDQLRRLKRDILQPPVKCGYHHTDSWNGKLLASHIEARYGQNLGIRQCQRLLLQLQESTKTDTEKSSKA